MEEFSFVTPVTGLNRSNTGKEDDDDNEVVLFLLYQPFQFAYFLLVEEPA
jgi:hypothetical protein